MRHANQLAERERLLWTKRESCALAQARGLAEAFHHFFAEDATVLPMGGRPVPGRERIREHMLAAGHAEITWEPATAEVAASGDLGYTWGNYVWRGPGPDGQMRTHHGKYISVWRAQADGAWRVILDGGNASPPPEQTAP